MTENPYKSPEGETDSEKLLPPDKPAHPAILLAWLSMACVAYIVAFALLMVLVAGKAIPLPPVLGLIAVAAFPTGFILALASLSRGNRWAWAPLSAYLLMVPIVIFGLWVLSTTVFG